MLCWLAAGGLTLTLLLGALANCQLSSGSHGKQNKTTARKGNVLKVFYPSTYSRALHPFFQSQSSSAPLFRCTSSRANQLRLDDRLHRAASDQVNVRRPGWFNRVRCILGPSGK